MLRLVEPPKRYQALRDVCCDSAHANWRSKLRTGWAVTAHPQHHTQTERLSHRSPIGSTRRHGIWLRRVARRYSAHGEWQRQFSSTKFRNLLAGRLARHFQMHRPKRLTGPVEPDIFIGGDPGQRLAYQPCDLGKCARWTLKVASA